MNEELRPPPLSLFSKEKKNTQGPGSKSCFIRFSLIINDHVGPKSDYLFVQVSLSHPHKAVQKHTPLTNSPKRNLI